MNDAAEVKKKKSDFFTYKGYPLVRKGDEIYYGNMYDSYVIMMQIIEKSEKSSLYEALDIAYIWLTR